MPALASLFTTVEKYENMNIGYLSVSFVIILGAVSPFAGKLSLAPVRRRPYACPRPTHMIRKLASLAISILARMIRLYIIFLPSSSQKSAR